MSKKDDERIARECVRRQRENERKAHFEQTDANRLCVKLSARRLVRCFKDLIYRIDPNTQARRRYRYDGKNETLQLEFFPAHLGEPRQRLEITNYEILMVNRFQFVIFTDGKAITVRFDGRRVYLLQSYGFVKSNSGPVGSRRQKASTTTRRQLGGYRVGV